MLNIKKIISHRGIYDNKTIYENTLESIKLATKKHYIIEIDIHLTKDNQIVVFHDYNTKRLTNKNQIIEQTTYKELNNQSPIHIPLLEEVLSQVNSQTPILIEVKQKNKVGKFETILMNQLTKYSGKYAIQSFNPLVLLWFKKNHPQVLRGQLSYSFNTTKTPYIIKKILKNMYLNILTKPHFISYKYNELTPEQIKKYQKKNIKVLGWTITNPKEYNKYIKYYDNLICDKYL